MSYIRPDDWEGLYLARRDERYAFCTIGSDWQRDVAEININSAKKCCTNRRRKQSIYARDGVYAQYRLAAGIAEKNCSCCWNEKYKKKSVHLT